MVWLEIWLWVKPYLHWACLILKRDFFSLLAVRVQCGEALPKNPNVKKFFQEFVRIFTPEHPFPGPFFRHFQGTRHKRCKPNLVRVSPAKILQSTELFHHPRAPFRYVNRSSETPPFFAMFSKQHWIIPQLRARRNSWPSTRYVNNEASSSHPSQSPLPLASEKHPRPATNYLQHPNTRSSPLVKELIFIHPWIAAINKAQQLKQFNVTAV